MFNNEYHRGDMFNVALEKINKWICQELCI
jgi:hypothetical protein